VKNIFAIYTSFDKADYGYSRDILGCGAEISLLNLLSYRLGYTNNQETDCDGFSYSFGLNLAYKEKIAFSYDYTKMMESSDVYIPKKQNFMVKVRF